MPPLNKCCGFYLNQYRLDKVVAILVIILKTVHLHFNAHMQTLDYVELDHEGARCIFKKLYYRVV